MGINITCPASMDRPLIQSGQWKQNQIFALYSLCIRICRMRVCVLYDPRFGGVSKSKCRLSSACRHTILIELRHALTTLRGSLTSYAAFWRATPHPEELLRIFLSYAELCWATPHLTELRQIYSAALSHAARPTELHCILAACMDSNQRNRATFWSMPRPT
jgi:hypothetical protein